MLTANATLQNRYRIIRQVAKGGMGAVYEAVDLRLDTHVAIKETLFTDEVLRRQFEREARLLARLHHPALPRVSDHFTENEGQFLVMQFIPGDDLEEMREKSGGRFPHQKVIEWGYQLLDALDYLHTQEHPIIHRDIKPHNLKLTSRGQVVLLDFGLAKGSAGVTSRMTTSGSIFGYTPSYAPLEQIQGTGTDPRSDLYSLAATMYHLMTGERPVDALTRGTAVLNGESDPLKQACDVNPAISPLVAAALHKAMALRRDNRPHTAADMRAMLLEADSLSLSADVADASEPGGGMSITQMSASDDVPTEVPERNKLTGTQKSHLEYWKAFREYVEQRDSPLTPTKPLPQYWMDFFPFGRSGFKLVAYDGMRDKWIGVDLTLSGPDAKANYHLLLNDKEAVEQEVGEPLEWREQPNQKQSYISLRRHGVDPANREDWREQHAWLFEKLDAFYSVLAPRIKSLNASEDFNAELSGTSQARNENNQKDGLIGRAAPQAGMVVPLTSDERKRIKRRWVLASLISVLILLSPGLYSYRYLINRMGDSLSVEKSISPQLSDRETNRPLTLPTMPAATPSSTPTPSPTPTPDDSGFIKGTMAYPSEGIPGSMIVCAENVESKKTFCTKRRNGWQDSVRFQLKLPAGRYLVYGKLLGGDDSVGDMGGEVAYYTEYMKCGMKQHCASHKRIVLTVNAGETLSNILVGDFWADS